MLTASMSDTSSTSPSTAAAVFLSVCSAPSAAVGGVLRRLQQAEARGRLQLLLHAEREGGAVLAQAVPLRSAVRVIALDLARRRAACAKSCRTSRARRGRGRLRTPRSAHSAPP